ncbi:trypsin-like serine protease [Micromonospora zingiberis]|uniref:Trypsin-like serine protease n=1 Tax=Micromonospora zingiberis TaxID=2053011 RepID=A0A4R0GSD8_9ACTN|nr:tachylectin-related carbohydrate-binding protein [Micromonospora zingiberis]TCB99543.1 trypsin-like serine protease [Micromonospora zingiberis]
MSVHGLRRWGAGLLGAVLAAGLLGGGEARAVAGAEPVPDGTHAFTAKVEFGDLRACTGALIAPDWVVTAKNCLSDGTTPSAAGAPGQPTRVLVGRTELTGTTGQERAGVSVVPHPDRNLALLRLATPVTTITPIALASAPPAANETLRVAGYGRTATEWVPNRLHAASLTIQGVDPATVDLAGVSAGATICKGDAGGPAFRDVAGTPSLVAINNTSWQKGCLGETETRDGATATRVDDLGSWIREQTADVQIFGILADGRLTYSAIDSATGDLQANRQSATSLGFAPKAMATLNEDTILVTATDGTMHRVDVTGFDPLTFTTTVVMTGWSPYDRLTYDGYGSLYGIVSTNNQLYRRTLTTEKPSSSAHLSRATTIATGFGLKSITSPGAGRILGNVTDGRLLSYKINGSGPEGWSVGVLATTGWSGPTHLLSPGGGHYYARSSTGRLDRYRDVNPFDGSGTDIQSFPNDPVSTSGWNQVLLSARPWTGLVSVYGAKPDGRISYTALDPVSGEKVVSTVSTQTLGFTPRALATLNSDTLLVTNTDGSLYRVDITGTQPLTFTRTDQRLGGGWTHDLLVYDGFGSLFGRAGARLLRYTVTKAKPVDPATDLINRTEIVSSGFSLPTLAATGKGHLLAAHTDGKLIAYTAVGAGDWSRTDLASTGWAGSTSLFSPGGGLYYRRNSNGEVTGFLDASPFDGSGADLTAYTPTGTASSGWDPLLSAQPYDSWPDSSRRR